MRRILLKGGKVRSRRGKIPRLQVLAKLLELLLKLLTLALRALIRLCLASLITLGVLNLRKETELTAACDTLRRT